jgi:hypothetical protein
MIRTFISHRQHKKYYKMTNNPKHPTIIPTIVLPQKLELPFHEQDIIRAIYRIRMEFMRLPSRGQIKHTREGDVYSLYNANTSPISSS